MVTFPLAQDAWANELNSKPSRQTRPRGEKREEVFDASSEDWLLSEQNQLCPLLELCFHCTERRVLVLALSMRASGKCMFAIFIAPVDRESQHKFLW